MNETDYLPMDWKSYGVVVKHQRKRLGYGTAEDFSATIWRRTRVRISKDSIYRIEQGKQAPEAIQFMAINISLFGDPFDQKLIKLCVSPEWAHILTIGDIPESWKVENTDAAEADNAGVAEAFGGYDVFDKASLFTDNESVIAAIRKRHEGEE